MFAEEANSWWHYRSKGSVIKVRQYIYRYKAQLAISCLGGSVDRTREYCTLTFWSSVLLVQILHATFIFVTTFKTFVLFFLNFLLLQNCFSILINLISLVTITWIHHYRTSTEYIVFRDGSCAIGMFRAITEINVLVQLGWHPLITQCSCTFHGSLVVSQHSYKYVNYGFESCSTQLFFITFFFVFMSKKCT